jgi:hypothetical protein
MRLAPLDGIMHMLLIPRKNAGWQTKENIYVGRREQGIGPPFLRGTS